MAQVAVEMIRQDARISGIELRSAVRAACQVRFHLFSQDGIDDFRFLAASCLDVAARADAPKIRGARQVGVVGPKVALALLACQTSWLGISESNRVPAPTINPVTSNAAPMPQKQMRFRLAQCSITLSLPTRRCSSPGGQRPHSASGASFCESTEAGIVRVPIYWPENNEAHPTASSISANRSVMHFTEKTEVVTFSTDFSYTRTTDWSGCRAGSVLVAVSPPVTAAKFPPGVEAGQHWCPLPCGRYRSIRSCGAPISAAPGPATPPGRRLRFPACCL